MTINIIKEDSLGLYAGNSDTDSSISSQHNLRQSLDLLFDSSVSVLKKIGAKVSGISDHGEHPLPPMKSSETVLTLSCQLVMSYILTFDRVQM
jgi:hypothetical protein